MPMCTDETIEFGRVGRRVVDAAFDGGVLPLKRFDERLGLTRAAALAFARSAAAPVYSTACIAYWRSASTACAWAGRTCAITTCFATIW